jgi:two-component system, OmpR family, alkaline phosphatase synthesis response regulator PhoP
MTKTILVIDDDDAVREVAQLSLEMGSPWNVVTASSGADGVQRARESHPDAILLDVMMPGMDGPATLERMRSEPDLKSIPVIFLTAKVRPSEKERLAAFDVAGVLAKPFDPIALPTQIMELLAWQ